MYLFLKTLLECTPNIVINISMKNKILKIHDKYFDYNKLNTYLKYYLSLV